MANKFRGMNLVIPACVDCGCEMSVSEWYRFFPSTDAVLIQGKPEWHCGCAGARCFGWQAANVGTGTDRTILWDGCPVEIPECQNCGGLMAPYASAHADNKEPQWHCGCERHALQLADLLKRFIELKKEHDASLKKWTYAESKLAELQRKCDAFAKQLKGGPNNGR